LRESSGGAVWRRRCLPSAMGKSIGRAIRVTDWVFPLPPASYDVAHRQLVHFPSAVDIDVPAILLAPMAPRHELGSLVAFCVIYFHTNACDIGHSLEDMTTFRDGALDGDAVMLSPEYPGYGLLRAYEPSVAGMHTIAEAAWRYCNEDLGFAADQIVLWGRSIGTGPAAALAHSRAADEVRRRAEEEASVSEEEASSTALREQLPPPCVGALVLLAPFTSISAVVEHHLPSPLVASVIGPMWDILALVEDPAMVGIPLVVMHPKLDEIIPSFQGQTVYERASCKEKFGVWLVHATHNFYLMPEHFEIPRRFLARVMKRTKERVKRQWAGRACRDGDSPGGDSRGDSPGGDTPGVDASARDAAESVDAEEYWGIAELLLHRGASELMEKSVWMSL